LHPLSPPPSPPLTPLLLTPCAARLP
jgi:hypothetical protein